MKSLITAIQTSLKNAATLSFVADADIFITPDENIIPVTCGFPAIGLKDGPLSMEKQATAAGMTVLWEVRYQVHVIIYVDMTAGETPVIGQTTPSIKGTLDINDLIRTVLHENYQSITGIIDAFCVDETESEVIGGNDMIILKKTMTFEYQALETF
jgi:hypothetical protein